MRITTLYFGYLLLERSQIEVDGKKPKANHFSFRFPFCSRTDYVSVHMEEQKQLYSYFNLRSNFTILLQVFLYSCKGNWFSKSW